MIMEDSPALFTYFYLFTSIYFFNVLQIFL